MERAGLNFEISGMIVNNPEEVAREGLDHLTDGPVYVAGGNADRAVRNSAPDRARVVLESHALIQTLTTPRI
jgi:hypothetical protein